MPSFYEFMCLKIILMVPGELVNFYKYFVLKLEDKQISASLVHRLIDSFNQQCLVLVGNLISLFVRKNTT